MQLIEICASLTNPDGSASIPCLDENVFVGTPATRLGAVEQLSLGCGASDIRAAGRQDRAYLNARGSGNRVIAVMSRQVFACGLRSPSGYNSSAKEHKDGVDGVQFFR